jgi:hypothetical protein
MGATRRACDGVRVLEPGQGMAGTMPGLILADNGAGVVKVEPPWGDWARRHAGSRMWNRGKRSVVVDLREPADRDRAVSAAARADVVVESFRPGTASRLGLGWDALTAVNRERTTDPRGTASAPRPTPRRERPMVDTIGAPLGTPGYRLIDADAHINEPPDLWTSRVPGAFRDRSPRIEHFEMGDAWVMEGVKDPINFGLNAAAGLPVADRRPWVRFEEIRAGGYDPKARLEENHVDKVDACD